MWRLVARLAFVHGLAIVERLASTAATAATATTIATATGAIVPLPFLIIVIVTRMNAALEDGETSIDDVKLHPQALVLHIVMMRPSLAPEIVRVDGECEWVGSERHRLACLVNSPGVGLTARDELVESAGGMNGALHFGLGSVEDEQPASEPRVVVVLRLDGRHRKLLAASALARIDAARRVPRQRLVRHSAHDDGSFHVGVARRAVALRLELLAVEPRRESGAVGLLDEVPVDRLDERPHHRPIRSSVA